jgi:hypothetical protein
MKKPMPSVSTRTAEFRPRELPLFVPERESRPVPVAMSVASIRIREALRRFFEEKL